MSLFSVMAGFLIAASFQLKVPGIVHAGSLENLNRKDCLGSGQEQLKAITCMHF